MVWTLEIMSYMEDSPWPATKDVLLDYAYRVGAPHHVIDSIKELQDFREYDKFDLCPDDNSHEDVYSDFDEDEDFIA